MRHGRKAKSFLAKYAFNSESNDFAGRPIRFHWRLELWHIAEMKIILYRKAGCPWAAAVMGFLNELNIPFEARNVSVSDEFAKEVQEKSGKCKSPTLDIGGKILADASVEDVARHLEHLGWKI
jgi:glutaredoxin